MKKLKTQLISEKEVSTGVLNLLKMISNLVKKRTRRRKLRRRKRRRLNKKLLMHLHHWIIQIVMLTPLF